MITWEQVPLKEQQALRSAFVNDPSIKKLDQVAAQLQKNRDFIGALNVKKEIEAQWEYVKQTHLKSYDKTVQETVKLSELGLPEDKLQSLVENMLTIFMACDIIETAHLNANEILRSHDKNASLDNFNDLTSFVDRVKTHLKFLQTETGYMDDLAWGDGCDKQYEMIRNKARSIMKKKDDINRWGQNLKKYIDGTLDQKAHQDKV
jgi:hypothetical protein